MYLISRCCLKRAWGVPWCVCSGQAQCSAQNPGICFYSFIFVCFHTPRPAPQALSWRTAFRLLESTLCLHSWKCWKYLGVYALSSLSLVLNQGLTGCSSFLVSGGTSWRSPCMIISCYDNLPSPASTLLNSGFWNTAGPKGGRKGIEDLCPLPWRD